MRLDLAKAFNQNIKKSQISIRIFLLDEQKIAEALLIIFDIRFNIRWNLRNSLNRSPNI